MTRQEDGGIRQIGHRFLMALKKGTQRIYLMKVRNQIIQDLIKFGQKPNGNKKKLSIENNSNNNSQGKRETKKTMM